MRVRWVVEANLPDSHHNPGAATRNLDMILRTFTDGNAQVVETLRPDEEEQIFAPDPETPVKLHLVAPSLGEAPEALRRRAGPSS